MKHHPLIGILVTNRRSRKKILKLHQRYLHLDMKLFAFTPADIRWKKERIIGLSLRKGKWKQRSFPFPEAVYNRSFNNKLTTIHLLEQKIGRNKCFNNINHFNKWYLYNLLVQSELKPYVPDTFLYNEVTVSELLKIYKLIYIKPSYGSKGESVYRVELTDNGDIHISLHSLAPTVIIRKNEDCQERWNEIFGQKKYMIQKGIRVSQFNYRYFDLRVLVQKGIHGEWMVSTKSCRVSYENYYNTSMCELIHMPEEILLRFFSSDQMNEILRALDMISIKAAIAADTHMGSLGELSVDFVIDEQRKLWIIELNGKPQKSIYNEIRNFKDKTLIYSRPMEYAYYLSQT